MPQASAHLLTPVCQKDEEGLSSTASRQVMQEFQAGLVTPMNIFNDEQHRLFGGLTCKELRQRCKEAAFLLFWIERGKRVQVRWQGNDIRHELMQFTCKGGQIGGDC